MAVFIRLLAALPVAALVTLIIFLIMPLLIFTDEIPIEEEADELRISIRDEVEEVRTRTRDLTPDEVDQVDPPPPPPQVEQQRADQPTESVSTAVGELPTFDQPDLGSNTVSFSVSDRDAQPLVRIEPQYPPRAAERGTEGYCTVNFDVNPDGTPTNISIISCSSSVFERSSIRAVERWRYNPKIVNGQAVARTGVQTRFDYQLAD
ncbi:energy transducer TonB [Woodsholea maritima]|uniref:energy transducer TonB n=1 Tax=Woodsholea maritima TaxID=240237 RepID=UPI00037A45DF|nr:energy transducer TonB [Woodsholea maritima]